MDRQSPLGRRSESAHEAATRYLPRIVRIASEHASLGEGRDHGESDLGVSAARNVTLTRRVVAGIR